MTVIGLADGPHDIADPDVAVRARDRRVRIVADPGWRPLLSGEVEELFGVTPIPVRDGDAGEAVAAAVGRRAARRLLRAPDLPGGGGGSYLRSKGLWNDPGSGKFAPIGWSTAKAKDANDRELLTDIITDALRSHRDGVRVQLRTNKLRPQGAFKGMWTPARLTERGVEIEVPGPGPKRYIVKVEDLADVRAPELKPKRPPQPVEPTFTIDRDAVARAAAEMGLDDVKVWVQGDPLGPDGETPDWLKDIMGGEAPPADWTWSDEVDDWEELREFGVEGTYRGYRVGVTATAEDVTTVNGDPAKALRYRVQYTDPRNYSEGYTDTAYRVAPDVTPNLIDAVRDLVVRVNQDAGPEPPAEGVLAAEQPINYYGLLGAWNTGPTLDGTLRGDHPDIVAIERFRAKMSSYGELIRQGREPQEALAGVIEAVDTNGDVLVNDLDGVPWRSLIDGRGYLSANLRALRGEEGFGEPDPDAIRFMQLMRSDFLAKTPDAPADKIRLYRATNDPDPWGGNDVTRFGSDQWREPSSGVTSWAFTSTSGARSNLSGYGDYLHGEDVPFDQVIGRFGSVDGELLVANDPALVEAIENFAVSDPRQRALDLLADLPDDPFAAPALRLSADERAGLNGSLDEAITNPAIEVKRRFPELSDDDARKIALLGGVEGDSPWGLVPEWLSEVPWPRLRGWAVDRLVEDRNAPPTAGLRGGELHLRRLRSAVGTLHPSGDPGQGEVPMRLPVDLSEASGRALELVVADIKLPTAQQLNTELTDVDRRNLSAVTAAGRVLLNDLRRTVSAEVGQPVDDLPTYDRFVHETFEANIERWQADYEAAADEARRLVETHAEGWIEALNPGGMDWPVGPLAWEPIENGLIDIKSPKFVDAKGRRFRMEGVATTGTVFTRWRLTDLGNPTAQLWPPIDPAIIGPSQHDSLADALAAVETARVAWDTARKGREEVEDLAVLGSSGFRGGQKMGRNEVNAQNKMRNRLVSWASAVDALNPDIRPSYFRYDREAFPDVDAADLKDVGDAATDEVIEAIMDYGAALGTPKVRRGTRADTIVVPLTEVALGDGGWVKGDLHVQPQPNGVAEVSLRLWRGDQEFPEVARTWEGRNEDLHDTARFLGALQRQRERIEERRAPKRRQAVRDWAAANLNATTEPLVVEGGNNIAKTDQMVEAVTPFIPDAIKLSLPPLLVRNPEVDSVYRDRSYYRAGRAGREPSGAFMSDSAKDSTYLHEYGHHVERSGPIARAVWAFYQHRTPGEDAEPLTRLTGRGGYKADEVARPDEFYTAYAGKDYGRATQRSNPDGSELFTTGLEGVFYDKEGEDGRRIDDEHAAFTLGLLLHAGHRAERYFDTTEGGETGGPVMSTEGAKDLDDLLEERARERRRRRPRTHFGRIFADGRPAHSGDNNSPFLVEDELLDRDNPLGSAPGVEYESAPQPTRVTIPTTPVADAAATQVGRRDVERVARGSAPTSQALREVVQHSQQALREQGIETVTLYRGARVDVDPFDSRSSDLRVRRPSGVTSWTTNPERAASYANVDGLTVYRAEVPVDRIVSYDYVGAHATSTGWTAGAELDGREVLVAADPAIIDRMLGRVTPDATMEGDAAAGPAPAAV